ncbi:HalOD1 output domain-containing protein [Salinigranum halophilum]|uniref:HalOD1 output domain-containing protein n=1 Tax=Salinigranum halophilum TaxID=2565931 RepID=UPI0013756FC8|nr:HalOD1 output domain-containing protein [Salinigranum halophilum]
MTEKTNGGIRSDDDPTSGVDTHWSQVGQRYYQPDCRGGGLTTAIVYAIAEAEGVSPVEVKSPSLYEIVDVPAIETAFFGPSVDGESRQSVGTVEFQYTRYLVKVRSDGWIQVYEPSEPEQV